jgi:hypothetical protein
VYQPIRNKIFAHRDIGVDTGTLLGSSLVAEVELILCTVNNILEGVSNFYWNGRTRSFAARGYKHEALINTTTHCVMTSLIR